MGEHWAATPGAGPPGVARRTPNTSVSRSYTDITGMKPSEVKNAGMGQAGKNYLATTTVSLFRQTPHGYGAIKLRLLESGNNRADMPLTMRSPYGKNAAMLETGRRKAKR